MADASSELHLPAPRWTWVAWAQALYYVVTGAWPVFHIDSFMAVTGPKTDLWLVRLFGACLCIPGLALARAARRRRLDPQLFAVALGLCAALLVGDVVFVAMRSIDPIYLLDAAVQLALAAGWWGAARPR